MTVICNNCKVGMECIAKRQNVGGELSTMSDWRCPSCTCNITIGRKGLRQNEDVSREDG